MAVVGILNGFAWGFLILVEGDKGDSKAAVHRTVHNAVVHLKYQGNKIVVVR